MFPRIFVFIFSFGLTHSLKCRETDDTCKIVFKFDQPLADDAQWSQECLTPHEYSFCESVVLIDYVRQAIQVNLHGAKNSDGRITAKGSEFICVGLETNFQNNTNVVISLYVVCDTKDTCATDIIRSLLPKYNTMKGRSLDIYNALKKLLIDPSPQSLHNKANLSCFHTDTNTTALCRRNDETTCWIQDLKVLSTLGAGCTNGTERSLIIGYTQNIPAQKPEQTDVLSVIYCNRDNCNSPAVYQRALELSNKFIDGTYESNANHQSSSIFVMGLLFLVLPTIIF